MSDEPKRANPEEHMAIVLKNIMHAKEPPPAVRRDKDFKVVFEVKRQPVSPTTNAETGSVTLRCGDGKYTVTPATVENIVIPAGKVSVNVERTVQISGPSGRAIVRLEGRAVEQWSVPVEIES